MGGPTLAGAELPPIDPDAMTASELRELMIALGLPVSEHLTPQETEAAQALAKVLPEQAWALLLNPGMTVRLEGAQGLAENSLEASLSRVQVAPGGERSQVLELSASLAVEAGLRSEALRRAITPELIDRLPEGAGKTVRDWKAAKELPLEIALEASAGERFTYQAVVPADVGARIAAGDMRAAPNPTDPLSMPVGSSVLIRGEDFTAQSLPARYKWLQFDETITALEGQGLGIRRVDQNVFEITTGPLEAMERDALLGIGWGGFQIGSFKDTRIESQSISLAQLDLSTSEGKAAYEAFMSRGLVPERSGPGVVRAGERESFTVDVTTGFRLGSEAASADASLDSSTLATLTRWDNGDLVQQTVGHNHKGNAFEVTAHLDSEGHPPARGFDWVATLNGLSQNNATLLGLSYGASDMGTITPENHVADLRFTDSELMALRDLATDRLRELRPDAAAAIESVRDDPDPYVASGQAFTPLERLVATNTPDEVFRELFVRDSSSNTETVELLTDIWSAGIDSDSRSQDLLPGPLPGSVTIRDDTGASVFASVPSGSPPLIDTTAPDLPPPSADTDAPLVPSGTDASPAFMPPPTMASPADADALPVVDGGLAPEGPPRAPTEPTVELTPPADTDAPLVPSSTDAPPAFIPPPTMDGPTDADALPVVDGGTALEGQPPVPDHGSAGPGDGAKPPVAASEPTGPGAARAPGYDMQDCLLRLNEEGLGVLGLQTALKKQGFDVPTDMRFGPETEQALRDFQARHGLKVDGIAGPQTFAALDPRSAAHMADGLMRQPDRGVGVLGTQTALRQLGHSELAADSVFGPQTERAVREFQQAHGLVVDGIVGPNTSAALVAVTRSLSPREAAAEPIPDEQGTRLGSAGSRSALSPDQQRHLQLAREQLGPALSALGHRPEQVERICVAAMALAQQHAERGPVKAFLLSKDGRTVAVLQQGAPMSEMDVAAALQVSGFPAEASAQTREAPQCGEAIRSGPGRAMV